MKIRIDRFRIIHVYLREQKNVLAKQKKSISSEIRIININIGYADDTRIVQKIIQNSICTQITRIAYHRGVIKDLRFDIILYSHFAYNMKSK